MQIFTFERLKDTRIYISLPVARAHCPRLPEYHIPMGNLMTSGDPRIRGVERLEMARGVQVHRRQQASALATMGRRRGRAELLVRRGGPCVGLTDAVRGI